MRFEESVVNGLREFLGKTGLSYQLQAKVRGRSYVEHEIFCAVQREGRMVLLDLLPEGKIIDDTSVLRMFVKILDTGSAKGVLVSLSHYTEGAKKLADLYRISLVATSNGMEAIARLRSILHEVFQ